MKRRRISFDRKRVNDLLKERGKTQKQMREYFEDKGLLNSHTFDQSFKTQLIMPDYLELIAKYLNCQPSYLTGESEDIIPFETFEQSRNKLTHVFTSFDAFIEFIRTTDWYAEMYQEYLYSMAEVYDCVYPAFKEKHLPYPISDGLFEEVNAFLYKKSRDAKALSQIAKTAQENNDTETIEYLRSQLFYPFGESIPTATFTMKGGEEK